MDTAKLNTDHPSKAIAAFLRACYDEDEQAARAAAEPESWAELNRQPQPSWTVQFWADPDVVAVVAGESSACPVALTPSGMSYEDGEARAAHIARHDPQRMLAEVAAKRRILDDVVPDIHNTEAALDDAKGLSSDPPYVWADEMLLRCLALPYADRPGYHPEWAPPVH